MAEEVGVNSERESEDSGRVSGGGGRGGTVGNRWPGIGSLLSALDIPCYKSPKTEIMTEFSECNS